MTDSDPSYAADEYTATVTWGDGNQDVATVTGSNGVFSVVDTHAYAEEGSYTATVTITDPNGITTQTVSDTVSVADAALTASSFSTPVTLTQGVAANGVVLAQFNDANTSETPSTFTASINWGDGNTTAGVVGGAGGLYSISGSHTYAASGSYTATVTVTDAGGSQFVISTPVTVSATPQYEVAQFSDPNQGDTASQFGASITWGDGGSGSGTVVGGNGSFTVMASHVYAEEGTYTVTTTIAGPGGPLAVQGTAQVGDPFLSGSQSSPAPPQKQASEIVTPKITFVMRDYTGFPIVEDTKPPGVRIHIDDSFYKKQLSADKTTKVADNLQSSILTNGTDLNLVSGSIILGPANNTGLLAWSVPNNVKVWWKPKADGQWEQVPTTNFAFTATGNPIPILVQGISVGTGKITATFTLGKEQQNKTTNASFVFTVYTGLNVSGGTGNGSPQANFLSQLTAASGYGLTADSGGNVWRTSMPVELTTTQVAFDENFFKDFIVNSDYANYTKENSTVIVTAVATAPALRPGLFDSWAARTFYPDNIAEATKQAEVNGPLLTAGILTQGLMEQYQTQIGGVNDFIANPDKTPDDQLGGAYGAGVVASQMVLGWGTRQPTTKKEDESAKLRIQTTTWVNANDTTTLILTYSLLSGALISVKLTPPGKK